MGERQQAVSDRPKKRIRDRPAGATQRPQRLLFQRISDRSNGVFGAAESVDQLREELRATSMNVGNLVHLEAPAKMLRYSRREMRGRGAADSANPTADEINANYDGVVLGYANMIRRYDHLDEQLRLAKFEPLARDAEWLAAVKGDIFAMGLGIQDQLEPSAEAVDERLFVLLKLLNDKAKIFGVRGTETEAWLHSVGLKNARALGCPSMFIYPRNVMGIRSPTRERPLRVATAGRIQRNKDRKRLGAIVRIGEAFETSYVFQTDLYAAFRSQDTTAAVYNDATGEVLAEPVVARGRELDFDFKFRDYWMFRSTEKWRGFTIGKDAYFGDRFHGGVIFLQAGKPAIIVQNDTRVKELTGFYDIPTATTEEILSNDPVEILHERLNEAALRKMRETYAVRYRQFYDVLRDAGLTLFNDITPDDVDAMVPNSNG